MMVVGITGPTGAGKSVVCRLLGDWERISIIDCDQVARQVVRRGEHCLLDLAVEFSSAILDKDGELNRRKLAGIVFSDREKLRKMEKIIYPYILAHILQQIHRREVAGDRAVFLDAPTLYQSGANILCQRVVAVLAPVAWTISLYTRWSHSIFATWSRWEIAFSSGTVQRSSKKRSHSSIVSRESTAL